MEDEVVRIAKKMDKMVQKKNAAGALDLLKELKNIPMTLELLQSTRIGMSVNAIRKQSTDEEVTSLAKSLIKSWKKLLDGPSTDKDPEEKKKDTAITSQNSPEAREESSSSGNVSSRKDETNARDTYVSSFPRAPSTSDSVRLKCREMLAAALRTGDDYVAIGADEEELGSQIEEAIYQEIRNTDMKYKNRVRSRISNLKDAKNPNLRKNVLCGNIPPDLFARMTAEEMASDELKEMRKNLTKEAIREHQMAKTGGTQTDLFTCGKCKKKNCTYTQVQTRSADEPMTTFVVCNECGNRWKTLMPVLPFVSKLLSQLLRCIYLLSSRKAPGTHPQPPHEHPCPSAQDERMNTEGCFMKRPCRVSPLCQVLWDSHPHLPQWRASHCKQGLCPSTSSFSEDHRMAEAAQEGGIIQCTFTLDTIIQLLVK